MRLKNQQRQERQWAAGRAARRRSIDGNGSRAVSASAVQRRQRQQGGRCVGGLMAATMKL
jgi:hypothetical protein